VKSKSEEIENFNCLLDRECDLLSIKRAGEEEQEPVIEKDWS
jgi:hypothetical protein